MNVVIKKNIASFYENSVYELRICGRIFSFPLSLKICQYLHKILRSALNSRSVDSNYGAKSFEKCE